MNVATALNRKYLLYTGVMLTSLCENNPCHIDIYILHSELTDTDIQRLTECVDKYDISIHPLYIEKDKFEGKMYTDKMWSIEAYYRLMLLDILPSNVKRMFYFDVDIIVNKSLEDFIILILKEMIWQLVKMIVVIVFQSIMALCIKNIWFGKTA